MATLFPNTRRSKRRIAPKTSSTCTSSMPYILKRPTSAAPPQPSPTRTCPWRFWPPECIWPRTLSRNRHRLSSRSSPPLPQRHPTLLSARPPPRPPPTPDTAFRHRPAPGLGPSLDHAAYYTKPYGPAPLAAPFNIFRTSRRRVRRPPPPPPPPSPPPPPPLPLLLSTLLGGFFLEESCCCRSRCRRRIWSASGGRLPRRPGRQGEQQPRGSKRLGSCWWPRPRHSLSA